MQRILRELESDPPDIEGVADRLLERAAGQPETVVSALLAIRNPPPPVRQVLVRVLGDLAPGMIVGLPVLVGILRDATEDEDTRMEAAAALGKHGSAAIEALVDLCRDADPFVRDRAADELGNIGLYNDRVLESLTGTFSDPVAAVRESAVRSLSRSRDGIVVPGLTRLLSRAKGATRIGAARVLLALDPRNRAALQAAIAGLDDESAEIRAFACDALAAAQEEAEPAVPFLVRALADEKPHVRSRAAHALQELGETARDAIPALGKALHDPFREVRDWSGLALMRRGAEAKEAAADAIRALQLRVRNPFDPEDSERFFLVYLVRTVGNLGQVAEAALPALQEAESVVADVAEQRALVRWAIRRCHGEV